MKKSILFCLLPIILTVPSFAQQLDSAKVTQIVNKVSLLPPGASAVKAKLGSCLSGKTAIATGRRSRAELEFNDKTLMRIGSSTTFSIRSGKREVELQSGSLLLQTPGGKGHGVNVRAGGVTAAITGSMGLLSLSRPTDRKRKNKELFFKFISVHGGMHLIMPDGRRIDLKPFQMLFLRMDSNGRVIGEPVVSTLDGEKLVKSSDLMNRFRDQSRIHGDPIRKQLVAQLGEKGKNIWTVVTTDSHNRVPGSHRKNTIGINALIKPKPGNPGKPVYPTGSTSITAPNSGGATSITAPK